MNTSRAPQRTPGCPLGRPPLFRKRRRVRRLYGQLPYRGYPLGLLVVFDLCSFLSAKPEIPRAQESGSSPYPFNIAIGDAPTDPRLTENT